MLSQDAKDETEVMFIQNAETVDYKEGKLTLNPDYVIELRDEGLKCYKTPLMETKHSIAMVS